MVITMIVCLLDRLTRIVVSIGWQSLHPSVEEMCLHHVELLSHPCRLATLDHRDKQWSCPQFDIRRVQCWEKSSFPGMRFAGLGPQMCSQLCEPVAVL